MITLNLQNKKKKPQLKVMLLKNLLIGEVCKNTVTANVFSNTEQTETSTLAEPILLCRAAQTLQPTNTL